MKALLAFSLLFVIPACGGDDDDKDDVRGNNSAQTVLDPEGTIITQISSISGGGTFMVDGTTVGFSSHHGCFYISNEAMIATVGAVNGLGNITTKPTSGWVGSGQMLPEKGYGYVIKLADGTYCRLFVMEKVSTNNFKIKYQYPF